MNRASGEDNFKGDLRACCLVPGLVVGVIVLLCAAFVVYIMVQDGKREVVKTVASPDGAYDAGLLVLHDGLQDHSILRLAPRRPSPTALTDEWEAAGAVDDIEWTAPHTLVVTFRHSHEHPTKKWHEVTVIYH